MNLIIRVPKDRHIPVPMSRPTIARIKRARSSSRRSPRLIVVSRGLTGFFFSFSFCPFSDKVSPQKVAAVGELAHRIIGIVQTGSLVRFFGYIIADFPDVFDPVVLVFFYFVNSLFELGHTFAQTTRNFGQPS